MTLIIPRSNALITSDVPRAAMCCAPPLSCSLYYHPLNKQLSQLSSPPSSPTYKRVRFSLEANEYHEAATSLVVHSAKEKRNVWYDRKDQERFVSEFTNSTVINMPKENRHRARMWLLTMHQTYQDSCLLTTAQASASEIMKNKRVMIDQERLRFMYAQEPNLVGMEDQLLPKIRADGHRRQRALLNAIYHIRHSPGMDWAAKEYHIRVLSQRISQPSRIFAMEIAVAQFGSYPRTPTKSLVDV